MVRSTPRAATALAAALCFLTATACEGTAGAGSDTRTEPDGQEEIAEPAAPPGFLFGAATAGFQVDMGCPTLPADLCTDDASDWYAYMTSPATRESAITYITGEDPAVTGPGHWEFFEQDYDLLRDEVGGNAFRMSIEWSRIFPTSTEGIEGYEALRAAANPDALATYHAMFAAMEARGITPFVTLHHYTLPLWIHDGVGCHVDFEGCTDRGWLEPERIVPEIAKYAGFVAREFGAEVDWWATQNEPFAIVLPAWLQPTEERTNPPAVVMRSDAARTGLLAMIEAHARMVDAVREGDTIDADGDDDPARVGLVYAMTPVIPQDPESELDRAAALNVFYLWNLLFLDAAAAGVLDDDLDGEGELRTDLTHRMDFIGLNYKQSMRVEGTAQSLFPDLSPLLTLNPLTIDLSQVHPHGLVEMLRLLRDRYGLPIVITENNGQALWQGDERLERQRLVELLQWVDEARREGIDLRGYFYWAFMDNYEWNHGMGIGLGLYAVDPHDPTKRRVPRSTVAIFAAVAGAGEVPEDLRSAFPIDLDTPPTGGVPAQFHEPPSPSGG